MLPKKNTSVVSESDLVMYLATGLKHLRLMSLLLCFSLLLGLSFYLFSRSVYYSKTLIQVRTHSSPMDTQTLWHENYDYFVFTVMKGQQVSRRVAARLGIKPTTSEINNNIKTIRIYRNVEKDVVVDVYAYSYAIARDWPQVMLEEYLAYREERQLHMAETAIKNYSDQLAEMKEKIGKTLDKKFDFRQTNDMDNLLIELNELRDIPRALLIVRQRLSAMNRIRESLNQPDRDIASKLAMLDSLENDPTTRLANDLPHKPLSMNIGLEISSADVSPDLAVTSPASAQPNIVVLPSMVNQPAGMKPWEKLEKDRAAILQQINIKSRTFLSGHPQIIALKKQLDTLDHSMELEFETTFNRFNIEYASLVEKKAQLEKKLPDYDDLNRRHDKLLKEYTELNIGQTAWNNIFNSLSRRLANVDFGADKERSELTYRGPLELKDQPISPTRSNALIYGLILGLALAIGVPFLMEYLNTRISDIDHAEQTLHIRGLGVVPKILEVPFESLLTDESTDNKPDYHLKENFRLIRTNLIINSENAALPQVILVTSAMPQEGKTCVAANLAISFASKGEKTLLIDGDLRRGRTYKLFGVPNKPGLSNVLKGEIPLEDALRVNGVENLTIMTCGKHINTASELLDSHRFTNLMAELRGKYQRIILDTPPVLGLSETIIMQRCSDGIMLVIWSDLTPMSTVKACVQSLQVNGGKFLGFVLNRLDFTTFGNRYKYFYYAPLYYSNYQPLPPPISVAGTKV